MENLGVEVALLKLITFSQFVSCFELLSVLLQFNYHDLQLVADHISRSTEDLRLRIERAEHALKEKEETNRDLMQRAENLRKEKVEKEEEHTLEMEEVIVELKGNVVEAI